MNIFKQLGDKQPKTIDDLLTHFTISYVWVFDDKYYVQYKGQEQYDNSILVVNKKTKEIGWGYFTEFIIYVSDKAKEITPEEFKRIFTNKSSSISR